MRRPVDPTWWDVDEIDGESLRSHLARHDIAAVFRYLKSRRFSWASIASATELGASRVSEIASGKRLVNDYAVLERVALGLSIPRHYMGLATDEWAAEYRRKGAVIASHTISDLREFLGVVASIAVGAIPSDVARWLPPAESIVTPKSFTGNDVTTVRAVTAFHRQLDAAAGGGACFHSARGYVAWATNLLRAHCADESVRDDLNVAVAELHNLVGWLAHDLDLHDVARKHLTQSLVLAREVDALPLMAHTLYRLGRVSLHQERAAEALQLFGLGQLSAQQSGCKASVAILHANTAWAYAHLGAADQIEDALTRARNELKDVNHDSAPDWARFALTKADIFGISAVIYTTAARRGTAEPFASRAATSAHRAVELRQPDDRRSLAFDLISCATAGILLKDYKDAGEYGGRAVDLIDEGVRSSRVDDRFHSFWELAAPHVDEDAGIAAIGRRLNGRA
jgi:tetratricopeptide (TPR) repeat protein